MQGSYANAKGKANFGFNAKYKNSKNDMNEVDGNTNFQFKEGDLDFKSSAHDDMSFVIREQKYLPWSRNNKWLRKSQITCSRYRW